MNRGGEGNLVTEATWRDDKFHVRKSELETGAKLFPSNAPIEIDEESDESEDEEEEEEDSDWIKEGFLKVKIVTFQGAHLRDYIASLLDAQLIGD